MNKTISKLKIGDRLILGKYGVNNDCVYPIRWLKATSDNDFISEFVLDFMQFDAKEPCSDNTRCRMCGNPSYELSNILTFINSSDERWYVPKHQADEKPNMLSEHFGFLYWFEEYEQQSMLQKTYEADQSLLTSYVRLPSKNDILGDKKFALFNKKGIRGRVDPNDVNVPTWRQGRYSEYWLRNEECVTDAIPFISSSCSILSSSPCAHIGVRPVCTMSAETALRYDEALGGYSIIPFSADNAPVCSDDDVYNLLGITCK